MKEAMSDNRNAMLQKKEKTVRTNSWITVSQKAFVKKIAKETDRAECKVLGHMIDDFKERYESAKKQ